MISYLLSFIVSEKDKPTAEQILSMLWYCKKPDRILEIVDKLTKLNNDIPLLFLKQLTEKKVTIFTHKIIRELLLRYNAPSWGVCKYIADLLKKEDCIASACAIAIGTEKAKLNKEFYHKIRVLKSLEMAEWRKMLKELRKRENYIEKEKVEPSPYTIGLFNEPLHGSILNKSSQGVPIISVYKGRVYKNTHCRTPIEISLDTPFTQKDFDLFVKEKKDEPLVIITKYIDKDVVPPKGIYLCFMKDTESYGEGIYPYISNNDYCTSERFFEMF